MTVSNEDRAAAIQAANTSFDTWNMQDGMLAAAMVDALIAHGWEPRTTIRQADIATYAAKVRPTRGASAPDIAAMHITAFLLQHGIQVTK